MNLHPHLRHPSRRLSGLVSALAFVLILGVSLLGGASQARAHPHVFVDTGIELIHGDDGRLEALRITWTYDEFFSLLLLEDLALDPDYDSILEPGEVEKLQGFDMDWPDDFVGDIYLTADGEAVDLSGPEDWTAQLLPDGKLSSTHVRHLSTPLDGRAVAVSIKAYDPYFYSAYEIDTEAVSTNAPGCHVEVFTPDLDAAYAQLNAALQELLGDGVTAGDVGPEVEFPAVGDRFAEEVRLICGDGS